jgi:hypothetical protein
MRPAPMTAIFALVIVSASFPGRVQRGMLRRIRKTRSF